jgi:periplasmic divalent cation tolerance protein
MDYRFIYVVYPIDFECAEVAKNLLAAKQIACVNILSPMQSLYIWQGKLEQSTEQVVIFKTKAEFVGLVCAHIQTTHPYETPCITTIDVTSLNQGYSDWLSESLGL